MYDIILKMIMGTIMEKQFLEKLLNKDILKIEEIRNKDGISVVRIICDKNNYVLKYFENLDYAREIGIYKLLKKLKIRTLLIKQFGPNYILMEDVNASKDLRLAVQDDLNDDMVLKNLAEWYKTLHEKGKEIDLNDFYCEYDLINKKSLKSLSNILSEGTVQFLIDNIETIYNLKNNLKYTLTYNDFAPENLIVGKNCAFMYDYNFVGKGYAFEDLQNVLAMLTPNKQKVFLKYYGTIKQTKKEKGIQKILTSLSTLILANKRKEFPSWGTRSLNYVKSKEFKNNIISYTTYKQIQ